MPLIANEHATLIHNNLMRVFQCWSETGILCIENRDGILRTYTDNPPIPDPYFNSVFNIRLPNRTPEQVIDTISEFFQMRDLSFAVWLKPDDQPTGLYNAMIRRGMHLLGPVVGMTRQLTEDDLLSPHPYHASVPVQVIKVTKPDQIEEWAQPLAASFRLSREGNRGLVALYTHPACFDSNLFTHFYAKIGDVPVASISLMSDHVNHCASFLNAVTLPTARRSGVMTLLGQAVLQCAIESGFSIATTLQMAPSDARLSQWLGGFEPCLTYEVFMSNSTGVPTPLR